MAEPWDRTPRESAEAYTRFLLYRNLGPGRSLRKAHRAYQRTRDPGAGGNEPLHLPGHWTAESAEHRWVERAALWDVRNIRAYGARLAVLHVQAMTKVAEKNARYAGRLSPGDDGWADLVASLRLIAAVITPELVRDVSQGPPADRPAPAPADVE